jgi:hypothetical protein
MPDQQQPQDRHPLSPPTESTPDENGADDEVSVLGEREARAHARDERIIAALAVGDSYAQAATEARCSRRTVERRMQDSEFRRRVGEARDEYSARALGRLAAMGPKAAAVFDRALDDDSMRIAMAAARSVFVHGFKSRELDDIQKMVLQILAELDELKRRGGGT